MQNSQDNDDRVNGRWTKLEHQQFLTGNRLLIQALNSMVKTGRRSNN